MATAVPVLLMKELNRLMNKKASDEVIPSVYESVIAWGCPGKKDDESFWSYHNRLREELWQANKEEWEKEFEEEFKKRDQKKWSEERRKMEKEDVTKKLKRKKEMKNLLVYENWTEEDIKRLEQKDCKDMDTTFLHRLVPTICDGIGCYNRDNPSPTKIERFLFDLKQMRNMISHETTGASISDITLEQVEEAAINVFMAAGDLYAPTINQQIVQKKIDDLKETLQTIKKEMMTDDQQRILNTAKKLYKEGKGEMKEVVKAEVRDSLPFNDVGFTRKNVFHAVSVTLRENNKGLNDKYPGDQTTVQIPITDVLKHHKGRAILCEGEPGSGKTTFLRRMREDFFEEGKKTFPGLDTFDLLLYMDCRDRGLETILQLLLRIFPRTMNQLNGQEACQALHELKLLICVDGLDELNDKSENLFNELSSTFKWPKNATFVCTSRSGRRDYLQSDKVMIMSLQPITNEQEQIEFLERYQENIDGVEAPELIRAFKTLDQTCKDCLGQPIYLALFCFLFRKHGQKVCEWKNELAIMENIHLLSRHTMIDRMKKMQVRNKEHYACRAVMAITRLSVQLLSTNEQVVEMETFTAMCSWIFEEEKKVDHYALMSSFFTKHPDGEYEVFHKSYLEYLAAKCLYAALESNPSTQSIISTVLAQQRDFQRKLSNGAAPSPAVTGSLKRCDNVVRFVCMLVAEGSTQMQEALQRFLEEVSPALASEVGRDYWIDLVLRCIDSDQVVAAVAATAHTVPGMWTVQSSRAMTATSKLLRYHQPPELTILPLLGEDRPEALAPLLKAVSQWHKGLLSLFLQESHANYSACDACLACLEPAQLPPSSKAPAFGFSIFEGCLSGDSDTAWRALIEGVKRWQKQAGQLVSLRISLLHPIWHELGQLDGSRLDLCITARPPSSPGDRDRRPLPTGSSHPPELRVDCRPESWDRAPSDEEVTAFIVYLAPRNMKYIRLCLLHFSGTDGALDGMVATLRAQEVLPLTDSRIRGWRQAVVRLNGGCDVCRASSHRPEERCVEFCL